MGKPKVGSPEFWVKVSVNQEIKLRARAAEFRRLAALTDDVEVQTVLEREARVMDGKARMAQDRAVVAEFGDLYEGEWE